MLKMCLNPKVIAGLVAIGVGVYVVAPNLILAALPLLLLAACPLSMLLMGGAMMRGQESSDEAPPLAPIGSPGSTTSEEEVRALRLQVQSLSDQQTALVEEVQRLRPAGESRRTKGALDEAEEIARAADRA